MAPGPDFLRALEKKNIRTSMTSEQCLSTRKAAPLVLWKEGQHSAHLLVGELCSEHSSSGGWLRAGTEPEVK